MIRHIALVTVALASLASPAAAQDTRPALRAEAIVSGDVVRIGDLIENAGIVSDVAIFRAPDLGTTGRVQVADLLEAVRAHALVGLDANGLTEITVTRPSRIVPAQAIEGAIAGAIAGQFGGDAKHLSLSFDRGLSAIHVEPGKGTPFVARLVFDQRSGRFDATLDLPGKSGVRRRYTGVAVTTMNVVMLNRALARGDIIKVSDVTVEKRPRGEVAADNVGEADRAVGQAVRGAMSPGRALRVADLMKPELVIRNESVTLLYEVPGIALTGRGKALESGAEGDTVEVLNVQSKRNVQGTVTGPGQVTVTVRTARAVRADAGAAQVAVQVSQSGERAQ